MKEKIGFIGLGAMGSGMAANLLAKGWPLAVVAHKKREAVERLRALGATEVTTPKELALASDVILLCVTGSEQVQQLLAGPDRHPRGGKAASPHRLFDLKSCHHHQARRGAFPERNHAR